MAWLLTLLLLLSLTRIGWFGYYACAIILVNFTLSSPVVSLVDDQIERLVIVTVLARATLPRLLGQSPRMVVGALSHLPLLVNISGICTRHGATRKILDHIVIVLIAHRADQGPILVAPALYSSLGRIKTVSCPKLGLTLNFVFLVTWVLCQLFLAALTVGPLLEAIIWHSQGRVLLNDDV